MLICTVKLRNTANMLMHSVVAMISMIGAILVNAQTDNVWPVILLAPPAELKMPQRHHMVFITVQNIRCTPPVCPFFPPKSWPPFLVVALKTQRQPTPLRLFHCQNKTNKVVSGQIPQNFCFLLTLLLKQSKAIGRAEPGRWIFQPGHLTWRALV